MNVINFLQLKNDDWVVRYFNRFSVEYTPSPDDNITGISFHKSDVSGKSEYHIFTDNAVSALDKLTLGDIKALCSKTDLCQNCEIYEFCTKCIDVCPNNWDLE